MKKVLRLLLVIGLILSLATPVLATDSTADELLGQEQLCPGDTLYPLKQLGESVRLAIAFSRQARVNLLCQFSERRLNEFNTMLTREQVTEAQFAEVLEAWEHLINRLKDEDETEYWEQHGISGEKLDRLIEKAEKLQALLNKLCDQQLQLATRLEERLRNRPQDLDEKLGNALDRACQRYEQLQIRIQARIQVMQEEGNSHGLAAMQRLTTRLEERLQGLGNKPDNSDKSNNGQQGGGGKGGK